MPRTLISIAAAVSITALLACDRRQDVPARSDRAAVDAARRPDLLVAHLAIEPGDRVADIGAGGGYLEPRLVDAVGPRGQVVATEIDPAAVEALARIDGVDARRVAPAVPGLEDGRYDLVLLSHVDHLLADRAAYLRRLLPALADGGRIVVCNRIDRMAGVREAADRAGLAVTASYDDLPAQRVLVLEPAREVL